MKSVLDFRLIHGAQMRKKRKKKEKRKRVSMNMTCFFFFVRLDSERRAARLLLRSELC